VYIYICTHTHTHTHTHAHTHMYYIHAYTHTHVHVYKVGLRKECPASKGASEGGGNREVSILFQAVLLLYNCFTSALLVLY
jgi:hypothetical protein